MFTISEKRNALWNSSSFIIISLLGFINFTLNYNSFSTETFGLFILINAIFGIGYSVDFGFGVSTVKHIAEALKKADYQLLNSIFITFFFAFLLLSSIICVSFIFYYYLFFIKTEIFLSGNQVTIFLIYFLLIPGFLFRYLSNYISRVFEGYSEYIKLSKINISISILNTLFIFIIFLFNLDIIYLAFFITFNAFLLFIILIINALINLNGLKFNISNFDFKILKRYGVYSLNIQFAFFVGSLIDPIIKFIIGNSFTLNFVTYYESAKKIIDLTNGLIFSSQKEILVKISESNVVNKLKEFVNEKIFIYSKLANYYSIFLYGFLNPFICFFMVFWLQSYEPLFIFLIFLPAYSLINFGGCLYIILMVEGKGGKLLLIQFLNVIFVSSFLYYSIHLTNGYLGLFGFYIAIVINTALLLYFIVKAHELNIKDYFSKVKFLELFKLNILLIFQGIMIILFQEYLYYILVSYLIIYYFVFSKVILLTFNKFKHKLIFFTKSGRIF